MLPARWIDLGSTDPLTFHATYAGVADAREADDPPAVVWGRAGAHICLGQSQGLCELEDGVDVPVVRRPLGGGVVWVDEHQFSYVLIAPVEAAPPRHEQWYGWALDPAIATFRAFGLAVERHAEDLWHAGRKIAGSGAATIGRSAVIGSSFLLRFPRERFARAIAAAAPSFRVKLIEGLAAAMTDWAEAGDPPGETALRTAFQASLADRLGWCVRADRIEAREGNEIEHWREELSAPIDAGIRRVKDGIKLNAELLLTGRGGAPRLECMMHGSTPADGPERRR
ncbi:MAG: lipoate--protein ligase family protein [Burkholderiales bacterium]|nr:lipoate--protein ligase family protein [Burkholderiales bacterium]